MTSASDLLGLQEIDLLRDKNRALLADIDARLVETEALIAAREAAATTEADLQVLRSRQRETEVALEDLDARIRPLETKLYGGSIRNPKELTDLQHEVETFKAQRGRLDDEGLGYIEAVERAEAARAAARQQLAQVEAEWRADQADLVAARTRIERETAALNDERQRRAAGMVPVSLAEYEKIRSARQGRAVARIERGSCEGCRIGLPTHVVQKARGGATLVQCPSCGRILVP